MPAPPDPLECTVGLVEDEPNYRAAVLEALTETPGMRCVLAAESLAEARAMFLREQPSICLVDLLLPDGRGVEFIRQVVESSATRVLVLSVLGDRLNVLEAIRCGARGYILKDMPMAQVIDSIRQVQLGHSPISPEIAVYLTQLLATAGGDGHDGQKILTEREQETLRLFSRGLASREVAAVMKVTTHTVGDYVKKIYRKLGVHSRTEALFEARSIGVIGPTD